MQWHNPYYLARYGPPSRKFVDSPDEAPIPIAINTAAAQNAPAVSFDPAAHSIDAATIPGDTHDAVRAAFGLAAKRLGLTSLSVRWFAGSAAPSIAGATRASDGDNVIWLSNKLTAAEAAEAALHECHHLLMNKGIDSLHASGRYAESLCADAVAEKAAQDFELKTGPLLRARLREYAKSGYPWQHRYRSPNGEIRL